MVKKTTAKKGVSAKQVVGIGAGIAALTAAAYVLFGPEGEKNRKAIRSWSVKMKGEIIEKFENAKELTEPVYHQIIDSVQAKYAKMKNVDQAELAETIAQMKKHWNLMKKESQGKKPKKSTKMATPKKK